MFFSRACFFSQVDFAVFQCCHFTVDHPQTFRVCDYSHYWFCLGLFLSSQIFLGHLVRRPIGDQNDRSKCLLSWRVKQAYKVRFSLWISPFGVSPALLATEKMGALGGQTSPRKGQAVSIPRFLALCPVTSQVHQHT